MWFSASATSASHNCMCLDLTDGSKENSNMLHTWECALYPKQTYKNQVWSLTAL